MGHHYSTREFFRQMPNALFARYFGARAMLEEVDFADLSETRSEKLFEVWLAYRRINVTRWTPNSVRFTHELLDAC